MEVKTISLYPFGITYSQQFKREKLLEEFLYLKMSGIVSSFQEFLMMPIKYKKFLANTYSRIMAEKDGGGTGDDSEKEKLLSQLKEKYF